MTDVLIKFYFLFIQKIKIIIINHNRTTNWHNNIYLKIVNLGYQLATIIIEFMLFLLLNIYICIYYEI